MTHRVTRDEMIGCSSWKEKARSNEWMVSSTDRNVTRRHVVGTWNIEYGNEQVTTEETGYGIWNMEWLQNVIVTKVC